tara:strand:+ start:36 stop:332 length:297 start_codon:yes stop_codon:yes gene_type:complete
MENNLELQNKIIEDVKIVTKGIIKDLKPNNSYASWKNTSIGLEFIKADTKKFNMAINMWIDITEKQLIGTSDNNILENMKDLYNWLDNFLEIKKLVNY